MDIDKIKWMVGYAEGFEIEKDQVNDPANFIYTLDNLVPEYKKDTWELNVYPLLLQRTIEGVNKISETYWIISDNRCLKVRPDDKEFWHEEYDSIDRAKEQSLEYIYEQEKINENNK